MKKRYVKSVSAAVKLIQESWDDTALIQTRKDTAMVSFDNTMKMTRYTEKEVLNIANDIVDDINDYRASSGE